MEADKVKVGKRVRYESRTHKGTGKIAEVIQGGRGIYVKVEAKDHPKGFVQVRPSQLQGF